MNKAKILIMTLCFLGVLAFAATSAFAVSIDVIYYWPNGVKVEELWYDATQANGLTNWLGYTPNTGVFRYDVHIIDYDAFGANTLKYFEVKNPYGVTAVNVPSIIDTSLGIWIPSWTGPSYTGDWIWTTAGLGIDGSTTYFYIWTNAPRGIVSGTVAQNADGSGATTGGKVSGPVPEPASLLLLGSGILGLALLGTIRKRVS